MQKTEQNEAKSCSSINCSPCEKGTTSLVIGTGIGVYGTGYFIITGTICPACIIATPALLGFGAYKRMRFNRKKNSAT